MGRQMQFPEKQLIRVAKKKSEINQQNLQFASNAIGRVNPGLPNAPGARQKQATAPA